LVRAARKGRLGNGAPRVRVGAVQHLAGSAKRDQGIFGGGFKTGGGVERGMG